MRHVMIALALAVCLVKVEVIADAIVGSPHFVVWALVAVAVCVGLALWALDDRSQDWR